MSERKILTLDIETSPHLCWSFQTWNTNITPIQIVEPTRVLCFAAKWRDKPKVIFESEYWGAGYPAMVKAARDLLDEADVLVTYNGDKFDIPHLNREIHLAGLTPPSPYLSVDLYKVVKKHEVYASHKLAYITERLGLSGKMDNSGWRLWKNVLSEDEAVRHKAWLEMRRYNKQDVVTTEELFEAMLPFINLPSAELYKDEPDATRIACPACDSDHVIRQGYKVTLTRRYQQFQCQSCGKWFRSPRSEGSSGVTP